MPEHFNAHTSASSLVLTGLWPDEIQEGAVLLGPWCLLSEHALRQKPATATMLEGPWVRDAARRRGAHVAEQLGEQLLAQLALLLDQEHRTRFGVRGWRILLGRWLIEYVSQWLDRYLTLRAARRRFPCARPRILPANQRTWTRMPRDPRAHMDFRALCKDSRIIAAWGMPHDERPWRGEVSDEPSLDVECLSWSPAGADVLLDRMVIPEAAERMLEQSLGRTVARLTPSKRSVTAAIDRGHRCRRAMTRLQATSGLGRLIAEGLQYDFPAALLEGFEAARERLRDNGPLPKLIVSGVGWQESDALRIVAAEAVVQGGRLVVHQHGAIYGVYERLPTRAHERRLSDRFLAWGWAQDEDAKARNVPCISTSIAARNLRIGEGDEILYLSNQVIPYLQDFRSALKSTGSLTYLAWQERFFDSLSVPLREQVRVRFKNSRQAELWQQRFAGVTSSLGSRDGEPLSAAITRARVCVVDCCTHVYTEALVAGPTVLFWDPDLWRTRTEIAPHLDALRTSGVLHDSPEDAARKVAEVYADPWAWWSRDEVRNARDQFVRVVATPSEDWLDEWTSVLKDELAIAQRNRPNDPEPILAP